MSEIIPGTRKMYTFVRPDHADIWPSPERMIESVGIDLLNIRDGCAPKTVIPGFKDIRVDGVRVGRWETANDLFGDDDPTIVSCSFGDPFGFSARVFVTSDAEERYVALPRRASTRRRHDLPGKRITP